ncbi:MAG: DUF1573 domain-containing protein [Clostridium sp.]|nr:DUF1573 domain-containing protein [Clostridium sp.]
MAINRPNTVLLVTFIVTLLTTGCQQRNSSSNDKLRQLLAEYIGQRLELPADSACNLFDRGYGIDYLDADYLVVSYIDTEGCTPCHLHLPYWKDLTDRLDTISDAYATSLLIIRPDTLEKVSEFIHRANYPYPVIIDTLGLFSGMNRMPEISALHTFLIDKNSMILALGNPIENSAVERIFMQRITGSKNDSSETSPLSIANNTVDVGTVRSGAERNFEFLVRNSGSDTITVSRIMTPCDCIDASAGNILPGAVGSIKVSFRASDANGIFHHLVVVRYNGTDQPVIIHIYGMVSS